MLLQIVYGLFVGNVFVVFSDFRLGGWCENRFRQFFGFFQSFRQLNSADRSVFLIAGPAAACDIPAHNTLQRDHVEFAAKHAVPVKFRFMEKFRHIADIHGNHMVRNQIFGHIKPESGHLRQHPSLVRYLVVKDNIKAADAVRSYHNEAVSVIVNFADLPLFDRF